MSPLTPQFVCVEVGTLRIFQVPVDGCHAAMSTWLGSLKNPVSGMSPGWPNSVATLAQLQPASLRLKTVGVSAPIRVRSVGLTLRACVRARKYARAANAVDVVELWDCDWA